jgi:hypothetical protein
MRHPCCLQLSHTSVEMIAERVYFAVGQREEHGGRMATGREQGDRVKDS